MDDLLDLDWSGKSPPPNIPQKPSYLQGNKKKPDAFGDLLNFDDHRTTSRTPPPTTTTTTTKSSSFETLLDPFGKSKKESSPQSLNAIKQTQHTENNVSQWNFDLLDNSHNSTPSADPFDVESLASRTTPVIHQSTVETDDDNPLGILSMPAPKPAPPSPKIETPPPEEVPHRRGSMDMLIAQMVDMGFEAEQAQVALEATGGRDLQDAVDLLVNNSRVMQQQQRQQHQQRREQRRQRPVTEAERARQALFQDDEPFVEEDVARRQFSRQPAREASRNRERASPSPSASTSASNDGFQQQKEKLVAQATELGGFLYKNASMFVKTGREKVNKAVVDWQEQQRQERLNREHGRPRWMSSEYADEEEAARQQSQSVEKFVDDNDSSDEDPALERQRELDWKRQQEQKRREYVAQMRKQQQLENLARQQKEAEEVYVSPSRRRATPSRTSSRASTPQQRVSTPQQRATPTQPKPQRQRPVVSASPAVMQRVNQARQRGNEHFKLGQFGDAESAYTQAMSALPSGHDHLVLLSNNRAAARLKIGEYKRCIEDCDSVVDMARISGESIESEGVAIQWREQWLKALYRKGDALENIEKYQEAMQTYNELLKLEGSGNAKINQALSRCRKAMNPAVPKPAATDDLLFTDTATRSPRPAVKSKPVNVERSKAVAEMRAQAAQQEADDAERLARTDDVNARIQNWKKGKEQNLRALLATLDTLLWPGAQWRGAQMSELIDPKRCKITYLKAIAKVHPDKLPSSVTIEQRMLASAIFTTLNEAWDSFKTQL